MYPNKLYIGMTKSKTLALFVLLPSIFLMQVVNGAQYLNATQVILSFIIVISLFTRMLTSL